ncbi:MAG: D-alanyl-D-alanine carboxypeptidase/D-alanyl-D-alanine-endopeptidase [Pirellulales bacterium]|nr:D-alanyl-D-alanine carboxypeptidase/D-alanyl-D-alanine-endopeptidase [Pirellulales bacterium]
MMSALKFASPLLPLLGVLLFGLTVSRAAVAGDLDARLAEVIDAPEYKSAHWGLLVADLASGEVLHEFHGDKLFAPASTTKLYSVAAALDALGADYRFETRVVYSGPLALSGKLHGDLILIASGDLTLGGRTTSAGEIAFKDTDHTYANGGLDAQMTEPDPLAGLDELARQVRASGISLVSGNVLIDDRLFDHEMGTGSGPSTLTPIIVNDNVVDVVVTPAAEGQMATMTYRPQAPGISVESIVETTAAGSETAIDIEMIAPGRIVVRGKIPANSRPIVRVAEVDDAAAFARCLFIEALRRAGVAVEAAATAGNDSAALPSREQVAGLPVAAKFMSPPFAEEARLILKVSHNLHASILPILLAVKQGRRSLSDGMRLEGEFLARAGVDVQAISFGSGAGGSRGDCITPRATVQLLRAMAQRPDFDVYLRAMPVLGVDGTLAESVGPESPARGKIQAKTGTYYWENLLDGRLLLVSKALAGYMTTASGRKLAFALFVNNAHLKTSDETKRVGRSLGQICEILHDAW